MKATLIPEKVIIRQTLVCLADYLLERYEGRIWTGTPETIDYARSIILPVDVNSLSLWLDRYAQLYVRPACRAVAADIARDAGDVPALLFLQHDGAERFNGLCFKVMRGGDSLSLAISYSLAAPAQKNAEAAA